jgi:hypothetical protein
MAIIAASTTALALLDAGDRPMPVHSIYPASVNLSCGAHLINASSQRGGVSSLCMTTTDVDLLREQPVWGWTGDALVGADGQEVIPMQKGAARYPTSAPPPPLLSPVTPIRLRRARARTGRPSWFDAGPGRDIGLPRLRDAIRALVRREPDAVRRVSGVIGLGTGLTPSADDALVGALCLLWADDGVPSTDLRGRLTGWLDADGAAATTDVSLSYLRLAIDGAFSSPIAHVVGNLGTTTPQASLDHSVRALSALGAGSGMDTALGIQFACELITRPNDNPSRSGQTQASR